MRFIDLQYSQLGRNLTSVPTKKPPLYSLLGLLFGATLDQPILIRLFNKCLPLADTME